MITFLEVLTLTPLIAEVSRTVTPELAVICVEQTLSFVQVIIREELSTGNAVVLAELAFAIVNPKFPVPLGTRPYPTPAASAGVLTLSTKVKMAPVRAASRTMSPLVQPTPKDRTFPEVPW